jgi:hypothetical protein
MASLYKNNGIWYIAVSHNGTRKCRSLKTKDIKVAKSIKSYAETIILKILEDLLKVMLNYRSVSLLTTF